MSLALLCKKPATFLSVVGLPCVLLCICLPLSLNATILSCLILPSAFKHAVFLVSGLLSLLCVSCCIWFTVFSSLANPLTLTLLTFPLDFSDGIFPRTQGKGVKPQFEVPPCAPA